jgi:hypothetical protein
VAGLTTAKPGSTDEAVGGRVNGRSGAA